MESWNKLLPTESIEANMFQRCRIKSALFIYFGNKKKMVFCFSALDILSTTAAVRTTTIKKIAI